MTHDRIAALETLMPEGMAEIVAPGKLERTTWVAADIGGQQVAVGIESTVTFQDASEVTGNSGCNNFHTSIKVDGKAVRLGPIAVTRMMCRPAAMDQEDRFVAALESTRRLERRSGLLFAYAEGPDPLVRFWQREELPK
jgi:heat shock protein HslJ